MALPEQIPLKETTVEARVKARIGAPSPESGDLKRLRMTIASLPDEEAKAAYIDELIVMASRGYQNTWPEFYRSLQFVRERELYRQSWAMRGGKTFESFEEYFKDRAGEAVIQFFELERTYQFAAKTAPDLLEETYGTARAAALRGWGGDRKSEDYDNQASNRSLISFGTTSEYTIARLDRDRPDLAARVKAGELSANAAAIEAGFRVRTHTIPHDPSRVAVTLSRHFTPDELRPIVSDLAAMIDWRG